MTKLPKPPVDCISRVRFTPIEGNVQFLAASWDCTVRLYDAGTHRLLGQHKQSLPILDAVFFEGSAKCVASGLSKKVILS
ncbi:bub3, partial [Symbiodinium pilosum]